MPDLNAKLAHLEALRERAEIAGEKVAFGNPFGPGVVQPDTPEAHNLRFAMADASPWLIPLAQQAEKLAERLAPFARLGRTQGHHPDESCCEHCDAHEALAEFEAIKKEAENGLHG